MKRGEIAFLRRPKRFIYCQIVQVYNHFPAVRVRLSGRPEDLIISHKEIVTCEERNALKREQKKQSLTLRHADIIRRWRTGMTSSEWRAANGWNIGEWSAIRALNRAGAIS